MDVSLIPTEERVNRILAVNGISASHGLTLTKKQAEELLQVQRQTLRNTGRVEFRGGTLERLMEVFCDSPYLDQENWERTLWGLLVLFYEWKNRSRDRVSDEVLLHRMKKEFEGSCQGSLELLEKLPLEREDWK